MRFNPNPMTISLTASMLVQHGAQLILCNNESDTSQKQVAAADPHQETQSYYLTDERRQDGTVN